MQKGWGIEKSPGPEGAFFEGFGGNTSGTLRSYACFVCLLTCSDGVFVDPDGEKRLDEGTLVLIQPNHPWNYVTHKEKGVCFAGVTIAKTAYNAYFSFLDPYGTELYNWLRAEKRIVLKVLTEQEYSRLLENLECIRNLSLEKNENAALFIRFFLAASMSVIGEKVFLKKEDSSEVPPWLDTVCRKMQKQENFIEGLERMVELSGKSKEHLMRSMQKYKHMTAGAFIADLRLAYAAEKLTESDDRVVDLCYESGFTSLDYFGKQFKKKFGMTPSAYRARTRAEKENKEMP